MCREFSLAPSTYARQLYGRELPGYVTSLDWYAFDVAAAHYLLEARAKANREERDRWHARKTGTPRSPHQRAAGRSSSARDYPELPSLPDDDEAVAVSSGQNLAIRGTEIPPWAR